MIQIEIATPNDIDDLATIHVAGLRAAYGGLVGDGFVEGLDQGEYARNWAGWLAKGDSTTLIARTETGQPAGFVSFGRLRTPPPGMSPIRPLYAAEIYGIYILPDFWRAGLGRQLMSRAADVLREQKLRSLCLWVVDGNQRAIGFYKAQGGQKCGSKKVEIGGRTVSEIAFGWRDTSSLAMPTL